MSQIPQHIQPDLFFPPVVTPRGDGTFLVKAGKPEVAAIEISVAAAARIMGCTKHTIYRYIDEGHLTGLQAKPRARVRLKRGEVMALKERQRRTGE